jgi:acyl carrier protein
MNINELIEKLEEEFEEVKPGTLLAETSFRDIEEWSSMHALIIIAMVDIEYGITLTGDDLRKATTIMDLYEILTRKVKH